MFSVSIIEFSLPLKLNNSQFEDNCRVANKVNYLLKQRDSTSQFQFTSKVFTLLVDWNLIYENKFFWIKMLSSKRRITYHFYHHLETEIRELIHRDLDQFAPEIKENKILIKQIETVKNQFKGIH